MTRTSALDLIRAPSDMTFGTELPPDNDWSPAGEARRAEDLGCAAARMRGVPVFGQADRAMPALAPTMAAEAA